MMRRIFAAAFVLGSIAAANSQAQEAGSGLPPASAAMQRLSIQVPSSVAESDPVRGLLDELGREPCDQPAIANLGKALEKAGFRREASNALVRFSETCGGHANSLRRAINILFDLSDYAGAAAIASKLIELEPYGDNGYFLRAVANAKAGMPKKAIDDYITAIELFGDKTRISSVGYLGLARAYEKLGQFCDAVTPIEAWVAINPGTHDNSQTRAIIAGYTAKGGGCAGVSGAREEVFPIARHNAVVTVPVSVNGTRGIFIVDTGATFVSLKSSFAQKAQVETEPDSAIKLSTANGLGEGKRGRAKTIQVRSLQAKDVPVVVQADTKALFGDNVDGLLGISFLTRFNIAMDAKSLKLSPRTAR
jgi:aspartyl protease family protein